MRERDKGLERKEMRVQTKHKVDKFPGEKEIAMAKKWRSSCKGKTSVPPGLVAAQMAREPKPQTSEPGVRTEGQVPDAGPVNRFVGYRVDLTIA